MLNNDRSIILNALCNSTKAAFPVIVLFQISVERKILENEYALKRK